MAKSKKPTKQTNAEAFAADLKLAKRAARLAATHVLTNAEATMETAEAYADSQFAAGSDAKPIFLAVFATLVNPDLCDWERGQYAGQEAAAE